MSHHSTHGAKHANPAQVDAYDWSKVQYLKDPIQTTGKDVIFSGHGALAGEGTTTVPPNVELWVLAPPGGTLADTTGQALESMIKINQLGIKNPTSNVLVNNTPIVYKAGASAPNYTLSAPDGITLKPGGPRVIGVVSDTNLSDLWKNVAPFITPGQTTRVFWAACTAIDGAKNPMVVYR